MSDQLIALTVSELTTIFEAVDESEIVAVDDVSFDVPKGSCIGIVGESGSGKTVLARSIARLLPPTGVRSSGVVRVGDIDLGTLRGNKLRRMRGSMVAMVFQDPLSSLNPVMRIGAQIEEAVRLSRRASRAEARTAARDLLGDVGIPAPDRLIDAYPHQLSGGMRQRVLIAIALASAPSILIADEPTTALDVTVQAQVLRLLRSKQIEHDMELIIITHDLGVVAGHTDEVIVMYAGQIVERAPTPALFDETRMPYTEALLRAIPRMGTPSHSRLPAIDGQPPRLSNRPTGCRFAPRCAYARRRCHAEEPELQKVDGQEHWYRCFFPLGEGQQLRRRTTQALAALPGE